MLLRTANWPSSSPCVCVCVCVCITLLSIHLLMEEILKGKSLKHFFYKRLYKILLFATALNLDASRFSISPINVVTQKRTQRVYLFLSLPFSFSSVACFLYPMTGTSETASHWVLKRTNFTFKEKLYTFLLWCTLSYNSVLVFWIYM